MHPPKLAFQFIEITQNAQNVLINSMINVSRFCDVSMQFVMWNMVDHTNIPFWPVRSYFSSEFCQSLFMGKIMSAL